ncbi:MAG: maleylpyruvate isomerase family mycothiol-dependent enzyme [Acidimicrobiia bacterium]
MTERHAEAYRGLRERTTALVRAAAPDALERTAPATPEWRVRDLLAHLVGVTADVAAGRLDGVATDAWTAAQVDARRDQSIDELLAEWDELGPGFETTLTAVPPAVAGQALFDAITHELDIRHALGEPGARDCDAIDLAFDFCIDTRVASGAPAVRVVHEAGEAVSGAGEPVAAVTTTRFDYVRAVSGRRTAEEITGYEWEGTADPGLVFFGAIFTMRTEPLGE